MNLSEFYDLAFSDDGEGVTLCIFDSEQDREVYRRQGGNSGLLLSINSEFQLRYVLDKDFYEADVCNFYPVGKNLLDVIIDTSSIKNREVGL